MIINLDNFASSVKKQGVLGVVCAVVIWQNQRLERIEEKLYHCLDARVQIANRPIPTSHQKRVLALAILPSQIKKKYEYNRKN